MKQFTKKVSLILLLILVSVSMVTSAPQIIKKRPSILRSLVKSELTATAKYYVGVCPVTVKMTGTIKVPKDMTVKYQFLRSDGAASRLTPLTFRGTRSKNVNFTWRLSKDYHGWVQLIVKTNSSEIKSGKVEFEVKCDKKKVFKPELAKIDWLKMKKPVIRKVPKFNIERNYFKNLKILIVGDVDLRVNSIKPQPSKIRYYQTINIYVHVGNSGENASPACKLSVTLKSNRTHPQYGDTFQFEYDIPSLNSGAGGWVKYPFHNFWPGTWKALIKIDSKNAVYEKGREGNNMKFKYFLVY